MPLTLLQFLSRGTRNEACFTCPTGYLSIAVPLGVAHPPWGKIFQKYQQLLGFLCSFWVRVWHYNIVCTSFVSSSLLLHSSSFFPLCFCVPLFFVYPLPFLSSYPTLHPPTLSPFSPPRTPLHSSPVFFSPPLQVEKLNDTLRESSRQTISQLLGYNSLYRAHLKEMGPRLEQARRQGQEVAELKKSGEISVLREELGSKSK